ncbi:hypothetical protein E2C01_025318 [Portunus trituberculatus]|uniref:Uncharacterized protein n=1 Tax=Portunus trituberculatus TaxID=210409 RepID=A0A5B7EFN6_PORTR|nr:hypothetical protein [Portunus trituberculatus]
MTVKNDWEREMAASSLHLVRSYVREGGRAGGLAGWRAGGWACGGGVGRGRLEASGLSLKEGNKFITIHVFSESLTHCFVVIFETFAI